MQYLYASCLEFITQMISVKKQKTTLLNIVELKNMVLPSITAYPFSIHKFLETFANSVTLATTNAEYLKQINIFQFYFFLLISGRTLHLNVDVLMILIHIKKLLATLSSGEGQGLEKDQGNESASTQKVGVLAGGQEVEGLPIGLL